MSNAIEVLQSNLPVMSKAKAILDEETEELLEDLRGATSSRAMGASQRRYMVGAGPQPPIEDHAELVQDGHGW